jgi:hypothetical protein
MARLTNKALLFTGTVGNMSTYTRKGSDVHFVRTKGGASKKKIAKSPAFEIVRRNCREFGEASGTAKGIRYAMLFVKHLADYNIHPVLTSICKSFMRTDMTGVFGDRDVELSKHRQLLQGFNLNQRHPFDGVVRTPVQCTIDRETASAMVQLPDLVPGINLHLPWKNPMYRFIINLGIADDWGIDADKASFIPAIYTPWHLATQHYTGGEFTLQADQTKKLKDEETLIVSVGIEMGNPVTDTLIHTVKHVGCAKLLKVG